jgi:PIN domain nuclease of toxin-antitoxin system
MKYLLDTHTIIWLIDNSPKVSIEMKEIINQPQNKIFVSSVSLWEIAIKMNLGKLELDFLLDEFFTAVKTSDFDMLQIEDDYLLGLSKLPYLHKDPFDRLIISTALSEGLTIITIDENIQKYDVPWIW